MKIKRLFLQAFGPFTDQVIDFTAANSTSNMHIVYGENEAGKSSALRAMMDLRFGIEAKSPDNFIHDYKNMRVGAAFETAQGDTLAIMRRKGNQKQLAVIAADGNTVFDDHSVSRAHELALTDGLSRNDFELMFGINHHRLREGGALLLKGEGELGAALFEASTGMRGVQNILATLEKEAKRFYAPRATNAIMPTAKKLWEDEKKRLNRARLLPKDWQQRYDAHEQAKQALSQIDSTLEEQRRKQNQLTQWRTVAPLLLDYDAALRCLQPLLSAPDLPDDAKEQRLHAQQACRHAHATARQAEAEQAQYREALAACHIEPLFLQHRAAIKRLTAKIDLLMQNRSDVTQQQYNIDQQQQELTAAALRITPHHRLNDILAAFLSAADAKTVNQALDGLAMARADMQRLQQAIQDLETEDQQQQTAPFTLPEPRVRQALQTALQQAHDLGDGAKRIAQLQQELNKTEGLFKQALHELGTPDEAKLRRVQPLLDAELKAMQQQWQLIDEEIKQQRDEGKRLVKEQQQKQHAQQQLEAGGDIITVDLLRRTRQQRDHDWQALRQQIVQQVAVEPAALQSFELKTKQADEQADMLRDDVKRAAQYEHITAQLIDLAQQQASLAEEQASTKRRQEVMEYDWTVRLSACGLPSLQPEAVREWQQKCNGALQLSTRCHEQQAELQQLSATMQDAHRALLTALQQAAVPCVPDAHLASLIACASQWERDVTAGEVRQQEQQKASAQRKLEGQKRARLLQQASDAMQQHQAVVESYAPRLFLATNSSIEAVRARLDELKSLEQAYSRKQQSEQQQQHNIAAIAAFNEQASMLASLLKELAVVDPVDFAERMQQRLEASETQQQEQERAVQALHRAEQQGATALQELAQQQAHLDALCLAAGVDGVEALAAQEQRAAEKKQCQEAVNRLEKQLRLASPDDIPTLRSQLDGNDIATLDTALEGNEASIQSLRTEQQQAREALNDAHHALQAMDTSDEAAAAREAMESAIAKCAASIAPWARLKLAHTLLQRAVNQFKEHSQAPMVLGASHYFSLMTDGRYSSLLTDDSEKAGMVLVAKRCDGTMIPVEAMSEGTADQLYLSLRLASLDMRRQKNSVMPLVLDDVLMTSDDHRAAHTLRALARFAEHGQVLLFTHHHHITTIAEQTLTNEGVCIHQLTNTQTT